MRFNLHLTHWSLFFVTLISSCFLFYVVASEYASTTTTTQKPDAANLMTSAGVVSNNADAATSNPLPLPMQSAVGADANTDPNAFVASNEPKRFNENHNNAAKTINIMPNYKKLKKQLTKQLLRTGKTSSVASPEQQQTKSFEEEERNVQRPTEGEAIMQTFNKLSEKSSVNSLNDNLDKNLLNNLDLNNNNINNNNLNNKHEQQQEQQQNLPDVVQIPAEMSKIISNEKQQEENKQQQQQQQNNDNVADNSNVNLPDLTDIPPPTLTVTEIPLEILQPATQLDSAIVLDDSNSKHQNDRVNQTIEIIVNASAEQMQKDEQIVKINDPGGGVPAAVSADEEQLQQQTVNANNIPMTDNAASTTTTTPSTTNNTQQQQTDGSALGSSEQEQQQQQLEENATATPTSTPPSQVNLTTEEVPIPVFSEWAQKQIEAAEKEAVEQEQTQFNNSAQRKNNTSGNGKPPALKIRAKNYASPSCGAKIIAASAYTSNAGAVLSSSSDEYMLSTCGNRIWFVVELCEAIQAQKIDFANFELYSSSPQNFSVAVSKRFPTRDWSNVGRFEAEDKRGVQSFDLHPQLFGKFVRVDISSHYSKEHYCTLSLFRVFGTSEFEAFETENHPNEDIDDFEDEYGQEQNTMKNAEQNLFKSASDAVLSIVKKATEVLVKPSNQQNQTIKTSQQKVVCRTPAFGSFSCAECSHMLVERINNALSCEFTQLNSLLSVAELKRDLLQTQICAKQYGIELQRGLLNEKDIRQSYYVNLLPNDYVGALCQLMATPEQIHLHVQNTAEDDNADEDGPELSSNLTIENKLKNNALNVLEKPKNKLIKPPNISADQGSSGPASTIHTSEPLQVVETSTEPSADNKQNQEQQLSRPIESDLEILETTTSQPSEPAQPTKSATPPATVEPTAPLPTQIPDRNMFNVPANDLSLSQETEGTAMQDELKNVNEENVESINDSNEQQHASLPPQTATPAPTAPEHTSTTPTPLPAAVPTAPPTVPSVKSEEDISSWDNIDNLLASNPSGTASGNIVQQQQNNNNVAVGGSGNMQQKQSSGPQSESVFIRLSNRIKTLERNMSLSGQYLEELSRRYKKQVEELQVSLTQQQQTVRTLEEENRKHQEMEQLHAMRNTQLKEQLDDLTLQVHACIVVIIFVGAFVFLVLTIGILFYRSLRRETKDIVALYGKAGGSGAKKKVTVVAGETANQKKINRRKSFDDYSDHQKSVGKCIGSASTGAIGSKQDKYRRPSEAAMMILKDCKEREDKRVNQLATANRNSLEQQQYDVSSSSALPRQRKISICYGSNNNINNGELNNLPAGKTHGGGKQRKGEKHSWPNSAQSQQMAWRHLEELHSDDRTAERTEDSFRSTDLKTSYSSRKPPLMNGHSFGGIGAVGNKSKKKKDNPAYKRQESAPCTAASYQQQQHLLLNNTAPSVLLNSTVDFDESLMLDSDDLDNFIPTTDLAYNEFMPDGPSGYQCLQTTTQQTNTSTNAIMPASTAATKSKKSAKFSSPDAKTNKSRRLSSPVFFKSPFSKSLKGKISSSSSTSKSSSNNTPHESTSWEWYRLKKSSSNTVATADTRTATGNAGSSQALLTTSASVPTNAFSRISPNCSLQDSSSSLSEINFPTTNSNNSQSLLTPSDRNSFRILEEAILSSGESIICNKAPSNRAVANSLKTDRHNNVAVAAVGGGNVAAATAAHCSTSSSNSNRSSSSSTNSSTNNQTKKKNRSFNKIFRKVF